MGKNSNVRKRKTFHDADIAAEKEQDAKREEKRKKKQAKLLAKVLTGPAVVPTPMDEERTGTTKGAARSKQPLRAKREFLRDALLQDQCRRTFWGGV